MSRVQSYVFWSTSQARQLVRNVLMKEPKIGMHHQQLFNEILKQYPNEKLPKHLIPIQAEFPQGPPARGGAYVKPAPALADHPVRSMRYLKKVILEDMLSLNQVEKVIITPDKDSKRTKKNALYVKHSETVNAAQKYRWRIVPGSEPADVPDPDPKEMFETKRVEAWKKKVQERNKLLAPKQRISTRYPPPPKRIMWLREREAQEKGTEYDPFSYNDSRRGPLTCTSGGYQRSRTPRWPEGVDYNIEGRDTFSNVNSQGGEKSASRQGSFDDPNDDDMQENSEDDESPGFEDIEPEPSSSGRDIDETGEQAVYDALFGLPDSDVDSIEEDDDYTDTMARYSRCSDQREGGINHRREFSLAAGQGMAPKPDPSNVEKASDAQENLSIPPFPKFNELQVPDLSERERQRLQSWRETFREGVEEQIQRMKQDDPANPMIKLLEDQYSPPPQEDSKNEPMTPTPTLQDGPEITFLKYGLNSSAYVRPSKPRTLRKESEPEREDTQPPRTDARQETSSSDAKLEGSSIADPSTSRDAAADITFLKSEPYARSRKRRGPPKEPEPERWDRRDLPEDILPPPIDTRKDAPRPMPDITAHVGSTIGVRHNRATRLYETLVRKSLTGPYAVPPLIVERDPATRSSKGDFSRSPVPRGPSGPGDHRNSSRRVGEEDEIDDMLD